MRIAFRSLPEMYQNLRIRYKIFLLMLLIMCGFFIVTYTGLQYAYNVYDEQLYEKSSQLLGVSANLIESELIKIKDLAFNVAMDPDIQKGLMEVKARATEYDQLGIRATITERLVQYTGNQPNLYSIEIADVNNGFYVSGLSTPRTPLKTTALNQGDSLMRSSMLRSPMPRPADS